MTKHIQNSFPVSPFDILAKNFFNTSSSFKPIEKGVFSTPIDIYVKDEGLIFEVACTGIPKEDIGVSTEHDILKITHNKKEDIEEGEKSYILKSITRKAFDYAYKISSDFQLSEVEASYRNGLLVIMIPRKIKKPEVNTVKIK